MASFLQSPYLNLFSSVKLAYFDLKSVSLTTQYKFSIMLFLKDKNLFSHVISTQKSI